MTVSRRPRWLLPFLAGTTLLVAAGLLANLGAMVMSPMIFDSGETSGGWAIFIAIWTAPFVALIGILVGWIGFVRHRTGLSVAGAAVAGIPAAIGVVFYSWVYLT